MTALPPGPPRTAGVPAQRGRATAAQATPAPATAAQANEAALAGYPVVRRLGEGADCVVHEIVGRDGTHYALKIRATATPETTTYAAFAREAALLARLPQHVAPAVHEVDVADGRPYQVMDLVSGRTIEDVLSEGPLDVAATVRLAVDVCRALRAVHRLGLVHRDLKPSNIIRADDGVARLIDFGLATRGVQDVEDAAVGTFAYSSPEQAGALHRPVDGRSDLYSLGVVLYECLTGVQPFVSEDIGELLRLHAVASPPPLPAHVPNELADVVSRLLAKDPDDRYPDADAVIAALGADDTGHEPAHAHNDETGRDVGTGRGRRRELSRLQSRWRRAVAGEPGIALLTGAAGAGKSWLAEQVAAIAHADGALVLRGKALPDDVTPFAPLHAVAEELAEHGADQPGDPAGAGLSGYASQLADGLIRRAADRPVLLLLDDVQWLDAGSRAVLLALADGLVPGGPDDAAPALLVLATARDDAASEPAVTELTHLLADAVDITLAVGPLDQDAVLDVLDGELPGVQAGDPLVRLLTNRCAGNAFLLTQYLRAVTDAGLVRPHWGRWLLDEDGLDRLDLPTDVAALVLARGAQLGEAGLDLLGTAALLQGGIPVPLLAAVHDLSVSGVHLHLRRACDHGLVDLGADGYRLVHDRVREALLARFEPSSAAERHLRIANALDAPSVGGTDSPDSVFGRAHHLVQASRGGAAPDPQRVLAACIEASRAALETYAPGIAVSLLDHACGLVPDVPADVLVLHAQALQQDGRWGAAAARLEAALERASDGVEQAAVLADLADVHRSTWDEEAALDAVHRGLAALGFPVERPGAAEAARTAVGLLARAVRPGGLPRRRVTADQERRYQLAARLHEVAGYVETLQMRPGRVLQHTLQARARAAALGPSDQLARCEAAVATGLGLVGLKPAAERAFAVAEAMASGVSTRALVSHYRGALAYLACTDDGERWAAVLTEHTAALDTAIVCDIAASLHLDAVLRGDLVEAQAWYDHAERRLALGNVTTSGLSSLPPITLALRGRPADAGAALQDLLRLYESGTGPATVLARAMVSLFVHLEQGELGEVFDAAAAEFEALAVDPRLVLRSERLVYVTLAEARLAQAAAAATGDRERRIAQVEWALRRLARAATTRDLRDRLAICRAEQALVLGRPDRALMILSARDTSGEPPRREAPMADHRAAVVRARALKRLGRGIAARSQAVAAADLAETSGWPHRAEAVRAEFRLAGRSGTRRAWTGDGTTTGPAPHAGHSDAQSRSRLATTAGTAAPERARLQALESVTRAAARVLDPGELSRVVLDEALRILNAERGFLFVADSRGELLPLRGRDGAGTDLDAPTGYSTRVIQEVFRTREPVVLTGTEDGEALGSVSVVVHGLRSILAAPLLLEGRCLGVVYLDSRVARGIFSAQDAGILSALATHVATALETTRAAQLEISTQAAQRERDLAERLRSVLQEMNRARDPQAVLGLLVEAVPTLVPEARAVLLGEEAAAALPSPETYGVDRALPEPVAAALSAIGEVGPLGQAGTRAQPDGSWTTLPLAVRETGHGALVVLSTADGPSLADHHDLLATLVAQTMAVYENAELLAQVQRLATRDELTGIANRRHFLADAGMRLAERGRDGRPLLVVMLDIDHFKSVNDTFGHPTGDDVIRAVAERLAAQLGPDDALGRYGGEEFALLVRADDPELPERLRAAVADAPIITRSGPLPVTVSVGTARVGDAADLESLLATADGALYVAKAEGRNRVSHG